MEFYNNFLKLCARHKVTPAEVAREIGISRAAISKWRDGMPREATLVRVAEYFGVTVDELTGEKENAPDEITDANELLAKLTDGALDGTLLYNGEPIDENTARLFVNALRYIDTLLEDQQKKNE